MDEKNASTSRESDTEFVAAPSKAFRTTTFNLEPEIIPRNSLPECSLPLDDGQDGLHNEVYEIMDITTEHQLKLIREDSRKKVRRLVAIVGVTLTVLCIVLVVVSLSFGPKLKNWVSACFLRQLYVTKTSASNGRSPFSSSSGVGMIQNQIINSITASAVRQPGLSAETTSSTRLFNYNALSSTMLTPTNRIRAGSIKN